MIKPYNRHELYIAALSDDSLTIPDMPYSREETYLAKINGAGVTIPAAPANRYETYLAKLAGEDVTVPTPVSRLEFFLAKACGEDVELPRAVSREEGFWYRYVGADAEADPATREIVIPDGIGGRDVTKFEINFPLYQAGTGDPSTTNIRPISGAPEVTIYQSGHDTSDPTEITVSWDSAVKAVYSDGGIACGKLDVLTGELTVTHNFISLDGTENWTSSGSTNIYWYIDLTNSSTREVVNDSAICSHLLDNSAITSTNDKVGFRVFFSAANKNRFLIRPGVDVAATTADFKAWLAAQASAGTPVQIAYELETPTTYQLTAQDIETLAGENHFWTDFGVISMHYTPDV